MSAEVLQEFLARLGFQVDEAGLQKFNSSLATATARAVAFGVGISAAATAAIYGIYKVAENNAELLKTAEGLGMTVEKLREMNFVADMTGSSTEALKSSLQGLQSAMAGALIGGGGLATFARLGIRIKDANGHLRDTSEVLMDVGKKIKGMDKPKAQMFLGQLGIDKNMYKMLTQDIGGITDAYREMYAATGMNAQKAAEDSRDFVQEVKMLKTMLGLLAESVSLAFVKKLGGNARDARKMLMENFGKIVQTLQVFINMILRVAGFFGALALRLGSWVSGIVGWFQKLDSGTQTLILGVLGFAAAWRYLNLSFLATPLGMIIVGLMALVALIDDFMGYMDGDESLIDWGPWAGQIMGIVNALKPLLDSLGKVWDMLKGPLAEGFSNFGQDAVAILTAMLGAFVNLVSVIVSLFTGDLAGAFSSALKFLTSISDAIMVVVNRVLDFIGKLTGINLKGLVGGGDSYTAPPLAPSQNFAMATAGAGAGGGNKTDLNATTNIYVDGAGDPQAVGQAVAGKQQRVNSDMVRNTRGAAR
jgi:hypothetical protein